VYSAQKTVRLRTAGYVAIFISTVALLVSVANSYFSFFWHPQDFRVYLRFPEPGQVGTNTLTLNYFFSNMGNQPTFIEDVSIIEFALNSKNPGSIEFHVCEDQKAKWFFRPDLLAFGGRQLYFSQNLLPLGNGISISVVQPTKISIDGIEAKFSSATVEAGKMRVIGTTFETVPIPRDNYNTVVICPVIRFFDSKGRPIYAICKGWQSTWDDLFQPSGRTFMGPPTGEPSVRLLPVSTLGSCLSVPVENIGGVIQNGPSAPGN
jgi:hypothetical protein